MAKASKSSAAKVIEGVSGSWSFALAGDEGRVWSLPLLGALPVSKAREITRLSRVEDDVERWDATVAVLDDLCTGLTDVLTTSQMNDVVSGWVEASGISLGE